MEFVVLVLFAIFLIVMFVAALKIENLKQEREEAEFGFDQIIDNYEQDFLTFNEIIDTQKVKIEELEASTEWNFIEAVKWGNIARNLQIELDRAHSNIELVIEESEKRV